MIAVRPGTLADIDAMSDLLVASITALCVEDHHNRLFVAEHDGVTAATGGCNVKREIILNYVSPEHRFAGMSSALLGAMEAALGPGEATLTSTVTARRFYLARGWSDAGAVERYAGMIAYPMRKML